MRFLRDLAGVFVGKIVLRAQLIPIGKLSGLKYIWAKLFYTQQGIDSLNRLWPDFVEKNNQKRKASPQDSVDIKRELIPNREGIKLDTIEIRAHGKQPTEYVIYGWGRNDCYEFNLPRLAEDALNLNKCIISFNYRGVGHSEGQPYHERDLINDVTFQVQRLIDKGVKPAQIACYAHSLGGSLAAVSFQKLIQKHVDLKVYADRPFANLIDVSTALYFKRRNGRRRIVTAGTLTLMTMSMAMLAMFTSIPLLSLALGGALGALSLYVPPIFWLYDKAVGWLLETAMIKIMRYGGWEVKAAEAYDKIPHKNKSHTVIRAPQKPKKATRSKSVHLGHRKLQEPSKDQVILHDDAMHSQLPRFSQSKKAIKKELVIAKNKGDQGRIKELTEALYHLSSAKITGGGHMSHPKEFVTRYKHPRAQTHVDGQRRLYAFLEPEGKHDDRIAKKYKTFS